MTTTNAAAATTAAATTAATAADAAAHYAAALTQTVDAIDAIADIVFDTESFDVRIDRRIAEAKIAKRAADDAAQYLATIRSEILSLMVESNLASFESEAGKVTVCKGKRTVSVTDKALAAEIALIKERGVRTGRCKERTGDDYVIIK